MTEEKKRVFYKCFSCYHIIYEEDLTELGTCPVCGEGQNGVLVKACPNDVVEFPTKDIEEGVRYCEICGKPVASNNSHSVSVVSRITGYLSEVYSETPTNTKYDKYESGAWNSGKMSEWYQRKRENNILSKD